MVHVYDQSQLAMQQIRRSAETIEESMGQLRFLQREPEVLEIRQRETQEPPSLSVPSTMPTEPVNGQGGAHCASSCSTEATGRRAVRRWHRART